MKKPKILQKEWHKMAGGAVLTEDQEFICDCRSTKLSQDQIRRNQNIVHLVPDMVEDIMRMYYDYLGKWESVNDHPSSNYGRDAFSLYETLVNAGCEPEKEETERFKNAGYEL